VAYPEDILLATHQNKDSGSGWFWWVLVSSGESSKRYPLDNPKNWSLVQFWRVFGGLSKGFLWITNQNKNSGGFWWVLVGPG
jgi:hypothetical protein